MLSIFQQLILLSCVYKIKKIKKKLKQLSMAKGLSRQQMTLTFINHD